MKEQRTKGHRMRLHVVRWGFVLTFTMICGGCISFHSGGEVAFDVRKIGSLVPRTGNDGGVVGQDGAYSVALEERKSVWFFGDTFFGKWWTRGNFQIVGDVSNSCGVAVGFEVPTDSSWIQYKKRQDRIAPFLENTKAEDSGRMKHWPNAGIEISNKIYLFYSLVEIVGTDSWDFRHDGQGASSVCSGSRKSYLFYVG